MSNWRNILIVLSWPVLLCGCKSQNPQILIKTEFGDINVELYTKKAPITASNFLRYVEQKRLEGAAFYRVVRMDNQPNDKVKIQVVQGGLYDENHPNLLPPIAHETTAQTGIRHKDGTLSMEPPAGVEVERMGTVLTFAELARQKAKAEKKAERRRAG